MFSIATICDLKRLRLLGVNKSNMFRNNSIKIEAVQNHERILPKNEIFDCKNTHTDDVIFAIENAVLAIGNADLISIRKLTVNSQKTLKWLFAVNCQ